MFESNKKGNSLASVSTDLKKIASKKNSFGKIISILVLIIIILFSTFVAITASSLINGGDNTVKNIFSGSGGNYNLLDVIKGWTGQDKVPLKGESDGRTNFLLIGKDYEVNTDTIMLVSYYPNQKKLASISFPRDMRVDDGFGIKKINAIWGEANSRKENGESNQTGDEFLTSFISSKLSIPIHYWARIDVDGLGKVIDELGGIDVNVDNTFSDCEFPTPNYANIYYPEIGQSLPYLYPCPKFVAGNTKLDAKTALIYARSRKSFDNPAEAIDFARNRRQQKVIEALIQKAKKKISDGSLVFDLGKINSILNTLGGSLKTSIAPNELNTFFKLIQQSEMPKIQRFDLSFNSGIICPDNSGNSSDIVFCDNGYLGNVKKTSGDNSKLISIVKDLLNKTELEDLKNQKVIILGNQSDITPKVEEELIKLGYLPGNIIFNNNFKQIKTATLKSVEKISIYAGDQKNRELFSKSGFDIGIGETEIVSNYQEKYNLNSLNPADIVILVESK